MVEYLGESINIGEKRQIHDGLQQFKLPLPYKLNHVNSWLLDDGDSLVIYDTGVNSKDCLDLWNDTVPEGKALTVIISHYHPDHVGLAGHFIKNKQAKFLMNQEEWETASGIMSMSSEQINSKQLDYMDSHDFPDDKRELFLKQKRAYPDDVLHYLPNPDSFLSDQDKLMINGIEWSVMEGPGHSKAQACLYSKELSTLIAADHILPRISPNISLHGYLVQNPDPLKQYLDSFAKFLELPADTLVLPSHGEPFYGLHDRIKEISKLHENRLTKIKSYCENTASAGEIVSRLFGYELDAHQLIFAYGEVIAHLEHLRFKGELEFHQDRDMIKYSWFS